MSDFMEFKLINFLNDNGITFNEVDELLNDTLVSIKQTREQMEYDTVEDYFADKKSCDVGNEVVPRIEIEKIKQVIKDVLDELRDASCKSTNE